MYIIRIYHEEFCIGVAVKKEKTVDKIGRYLNSIRLYWSCKFCSFINVEEGILYD